MSQSEPAHVDHGWSSGWQSFWEVRNMADFIKKVEEAWDAGTDAGRRLDEATGASDTWSTAAVDADPELARSAADDWDKGDHAKAVGKFARATGEAIVDGVEDFWSGITGEVEAEAPPTINIESHEEVSMSSSSVAHEDPPPPPSE